MNAGHSWLTKAVFYGGSGASAPSRCESRLRLFAGIGLISWLPHTAPADTVAPTITAETACPWGSDDCNPCVPDAVDAIQRLRDHGDPMGFHTNSTPDVDLFHHWQGIQRLMSGGGNYLAVSRSLPGEETDVSFVIVRMGSRNDEGLRFRSNRLNSARFFEDTPPPAEDGVVVTMPHEPGFTHAGGMQLLGNILAVPFEDAGQSKVVLYDLADPLAPVRLDNEIDHSDLSGEAGSASLGKLADGRVLLIVGRANANTLDFYVSTGADVRTTGFEWFDTWNEDELLTEIGDSEFGNYQNLNLLAQCDGTFYLIGTHEDTFGPGEDFVDLYRLENGTGNDVTITKVAKKHLFCDYRGQANCNLDAAGGIYVDPVGRLYIYGTEHDNDGPIGDGPGGCHSAGISCSGPECSVKMAEFRPVPHGPCDRIQDAWVELYDDSGLGDRSVMFDFVDRHLENYTNLNQVEDIEDKPSSVRWCLPPGFSYRLWENRGPCSGDTLDLVGTGTMESIADLDDVGFGDDASCSEWLGVSVPAQSITFTSRIGQNFARCGTYETGSVVTHALNSLEPTLDSISVSDPGGATWPESDATAQLDANPWPTGISLAVCGSASRGAPQGNGTTASTRTVDHWSFTLSTPACFTLSGSLNADSTSASSARQNYNLMSLTGPNQIILDDGTVTGGLGAQISAPGTVTKNASGRLLAGDYYISLRGEASSGSSFPNSGSYANRVVLTVAHCLGDCEADGDTDLDDYAAFTACLNGPGGGAVGGCECTDFDHDGDSDLLDFAEFQVEFAN